MTDIDYQIMYWLRNSRGFPRDVGVAYGGEIKGRKTVEDLAELVGYIDEQDYIDCYATIFANWQIRTRKVDVVFLDVDDHEDGETEGHLKDCVKDILDSFGYSYDLYSTGRGYHFYLRFPEMRIEDYNTAAKNWADDIGLSDYVDIVGNINQLARLPRSYNGKTGTMMELVEKGKVNIELGNDILLFAEVKNTEYIDGNGLLRDVDMSEFPDCMKQAINLLIKTGELEHYWRVVLGIFLIKALGFEDAHKVFSLANDYDWAKTEQYLQYSKKKEHKAYSCKKMRMLGMCCYNSIHDCPYGHISDGWLEKLL